MVLAYGSGGQHMNEQEKHAVSQEERKEKIRARYKGVDRSELEFIPAKQKEKLFEDVGTKECVHIVVCLRTTLIRHLHMNCRKIIMKI